MPAVKFKKTLGDLLIQNGDTNNGVSKIEQAVTKNNNDYAIAYKAATLYRKYKVLASSTILNRTLLNLSSYVNSSS